MLCESGDVRGVEVGEELAAAIHCVQHVVRRAINCAFSLFSYRIHTLEQRFRPDSIPDCDVQMIEPAAPYGDAGTRPPYRAKPIADGAADKAVALLLTFVRFSLLQAASGEDMPAARCLIHLLPNQPARSPSGTSLLHCKSSGRGDPSTLPQPSSARATLAWASTTDAFRLPLALSAHSGSVAERSQPAWFLLTSKTLG